MKKLWMGLAFLLWMPFHIYGQSKQERKEIKKEINILLDNWHKFAANSDFDNYFSLMGKEAVFVGTDSSEVWSKKEFMKYAKEPFKNKKGWKFIPLSRNIYMGKNPDYVWFDELLDTQMGKCRGSGVAVNENGEWLIMHYVLSLTVPNDKLKMVKRIISY